MQDTSSDCDYDFVETPSSDYFCPVTFELLLSCPQLTECCGNHISLTAISKLKAEAKPCPLCANSDLTTHNDKYFERRVRELKVKCQNLINGCSWVGEVGCFRDHLLSCPKRQWQCPHCDFSSIYDAGMEKHVVECDQWPEPCPNKCVVVCVPRCDMKKHLTECSLQLLVCEFQEVGCEVQVLRKDMNHHLEEFAQHHMMICALSSLKLTRQLRAELHEDDAEYDELITQLQQKDDQLKRKDKQLDDRHDQMKGKDRQLRQKDEIIKQKNRSLEEKQCHLKLKDDDLRKKDEQLQVKDSQIKKKDEQLARKDSQLKEKDSQLKHRDNKLDHKEGQLLQRDEQLQHKDKQLEEITQQLKEKDDYIKQKERMEEEKYRLYVVQIREKDALLKDKDEQLKKKEGQERLKDIQLKEKG